MRKQGSFAWRKRQTEDIDKWRKYVQDISVDNRMALTILNIIYIIIRPYH